MSSSYDVISRLPELPLEPFEVAGKLGYSDRGPFVTIKPHKQPEPTKPATPPMPPKSQAFIRTYLSQAVYPRVICYHPGDQRPTRLPRTVDTVEARGRPSTDFVAIARQERFYKLSALNDVRFRNPYWCSVRAGPWLAMAVERESCTTGEPNSWEFFIVEMPEVSLHWYGTWEDMPAYPSLQVFGHGLIDERWDCCGGFKWCATTQSCIPNQVPCKDPVPA
jgi:hypothetical protein